MYHTFYGYCSQYFPFFFDHEKKGHEEEKGTDYESEGKEKGTENKPEGAQTPTQTPTQTPMQTQSSAASS
jgi:hypothetical protein